MLSKEGDQLRNIMVESGYEVTPDELEESLTRLTWIKLGGETKLK